MHTNPNTGAAKTWGSLTSSQVDSRILSQTKYHKIEQSKTKDKTDQGGFLVYMKYTHYYACTHVHMHPQNSQNYIIPKFATKET